MAAGTTARLGRFIEYIPESVTLGFTGGIAIVIAVLQIPDFTGMPIGHLPEHFVGKVSVIGANLAGIDAGSCLLALLTLVAMITWPRLRLPVPPHLPALALVSVVGAVLVAQGIEVDTIGSRFHYLQADGTQAAGIPPYLPTFDWPWNHPGADGEPLTLSLELVSELLPSAFAIAMLGAIESLLCAVVLDGMSGKRHSANSELLAQGVGNLVTPLFGGITATAAIARSATNFKAGAVSPLAGVVHALVVLLGLLLFASALAYVPMPAMAALLMVVAWNMSEAHKARKLVQKSPRGDVLVFLTCLSLTVLLDMVIAITAGVVLASLLFMKEIASLTQVVDVTENRVLVREGLPGKWKVFKVRGPLFFAAADRIFSEIFHRAQGLDGLIIHMEYSSYLDAGGLSAVDRLLAQCADKQISIRFSCWQFQPLKTLAKARSAGVGPLEVSFSTLEGAIDAVLSKGTNHEVG
ncbi:MAG: STAS domain-containing protein [Gammaproteobacteria bacterium]|nr:STAS domain-containing protein [Gammaproteobacteria bacterium]